MYKIYNGRIYKLCMVHTNKNERLYIIIHMYLHALLIFETTPYAMLFDIGKALA
jgi:hypothetical protein